MPKRGETAAGEDAGDLGGLGDDRSARGLCNERIVGSDAVRAPQEGDQQEGQRQDGLRREQGPSTEIVRAGVGDGEPNAFAQRGDGAIDGDDKGRGEGGAAQRGDLRNGQPSRRGQGQAQRIPRKAGKEVGTQAFQSGPQRGLQHRGQGDAPKARFCGEAHAKGRGQARKGGDKNGQDGAKPEQCGKDKVPGAIVVGQREHPPQLPHPRDQADQPAQPKGPAHRDMAHQQQKRNQREPDVAGLPNGRPQRDNQGGGEKRGGELQESLLHGEVLSARMSVVWP